MAVRLQRCIDAMAAAAGRPLTDDELIRVAERLQDRVERLRKTRGSASDDDLLRAASAELREEANREAALLRRSAMLSAAANARIQGVIARYPDPVMALRAILAGVNTPGGPSRFSIDYRGKALAHEWTGALVAALRQASPDDRLLTAFRRGTHDDDIAREMWAMRPGRAAERGAGVTGNADAYAIAAIVHNVQEQGVLRANRAGAWIEFLPGYIARQSHEPTRILRAGYEKWRDFVRPLLGAETFERQQARVDRLEAERASSSAELEQATIDSKALPTVLTPWAQRLRDELERNQVAGVQRDTIVKIADRLEGLKAAEADDKTGRTLRRQVDRLRRDAGRALDRLDRSANRSEGLHQFLTRMVDDINSIADRRRRAEARLSAAEGGLKDLENLGRVDDSEEFLRAVFDDIVSGRTLHPEMGSNYVAGAGGNANVAMKMSRARVLHFADADAWMRYQREFGRPGQLATAAVHGLERLANFTALIETLGPNPGATFLRARAKIAADFHSNPNIVRDVQAEELTHLFEHVSGGANAIANPTRAQVGALVRGFNVVTKLGMMVISSVTDTVSLASEARFQGKGWLSGYAAGLEDVLKGRRGGEERLVADVAGAGLEGFTSSVGARLGSVDGAPGMMAWAVRKFYALNLGSMWTDSHKIGATFMQTRGWALDKAKAFAELDDESRRLFGLYGIGATEWDLLRATRTVDANGRGHLLPAEIRKLPTDQVTAIVNGPPVPGKARRELTDFEAIRILDDAGDRFSTLLADRADYAVPTPGAREQAWMYGGHRPGSWFGEALRLFWQFKQFPVSVLSKSVGRDLYSSESRFAAATGLASFFLQATAMGYVAMSLKDVLKNKEPRNPLEWQTWLAAAAQGGGAGIYGDFLFGEFNRFGRSWAETAMGPTFGGLVPDVAELVAKALRADNKGQWELKGRDGVRIVANNLPFVGLFYTRPILDQILASEVYERLNPGYRRRLERQMQHEEGRGFLFHP